MAENTRFAYVFMYYFSRIGLLLLTVIISPICWFYSGKKKQCPPIKNPLLFYSATKLAEMIRTKQIKCEEIVQAYIDRIIEVNKIVNAVVEDRFAEALQEAIELDRKIAESNKTVEEIALETPLLGVPITIKESIMVKGMSCNVGQVNSNYKCDKDSPLVAEIKKAGGIITAVTNTPELCMFWETYNRVTGVTKNPYDNRCTVGGSSGGEAALVSSGGSILGLGSDLGGSLRLPGFFTGIFVHKSTAGLTDIEGSRPVVLDKNIEKHLSFGPLARCSEDLPLLMSIISKPEYKYIFEKKKDYFKNLKIFIMEKENTCALAKNVNSDITSAMKIFANHLKNKFDAQIKIVKIKDFQYSFPISIEYILGLDKIESPYADSDLNFHFLPQFFKFITFQTKSTLPIFFYGVIKYLQTLLLNTPKTKLNAERERLKKSIEDILGDNGILLYPTFTSPAHYHFGMFYKLMDFSYVSIFNVLGLPVTNVPSGFVNKLPIGFQIVAKSYNDMLTMAVAKEAEKYFGGWKPPGL